MAKIQNEIAYMAAMERIEELLPLVDDDTPLTDRKSYRIRFIVRTCRGV